jgi:hypothetical protein
MIECEQDLKQGYRSRRNICSVSEGGQRVWRLRKLHQYVDAELVVDGEGVELQFLLNGARSYSRRWPTRALALADASEKRAELEREGWMFHW